MRPATAGPRREVAERPRPASGPTPSAAAPGSGEVVEVAAIGADRRRREAALDAEVGQEVGDCAVERRRGGHVSPACRGGRSPGLRPVEQLAGRGSGGRTAARPASIWASSTIRPSRSSAVTSVTVRPSRSRLRDLEVGVGVGGDLGQVGHAQDLVAAGERPEAPPDRDRRCGHRCPVSTSSKTSVGVSSAAARTCLIARATRLISPPEAILRERPRRLAGIRGEPDRRPRRCPIASNARASPPISTAGSSATGRPPPEDDFEHAGREAELLEDAADLVGQPAGRLRSGVGELLAGHGDRDEQPRLLRLPRRPLRRRVLAAAPPRPRPARRGR